MTRKDYIKLAEELKAVKNNLSNLDALGTFREIEFRIRVVLANDNPRFNFQKWEAYING